MLNTNERLEQLVARNSLKAAKDVGPTGTADNPTIDQLAHPRSYYYSTPMRQTFAEMSRQLCVEAARRWGPRWEYERTASNSEFNEFVLEKLREFTTVKLYQGYKEYRASDLRNQTPLHATVAMWAIPEIEERFLDTVREARERIRPWGVCNVAARTMWNVTIGASRFLGTSQIPRMLSKQWFQEKRAMLQFYHRAYQKFFFGVEEGILKEVAFLEGRPEIGLGTGFKERFQKTLLEGMLKKDPKGN